MHYIKTYMAEMRHFLILWLGQSVSSLGTAMTGFALSIWAFERTGSALVLSVSALLVMLPRMLMGIFVSPFVDRNNKKRIMICADTGTGICTLVLFLLLRFDALEIWHIFGINFITSILGSFQTLAGSVAVSVVVPEKHYVRANGLKSFSSGIVEVISPALAAVLLGLVGISGIIAIDVLTMVSACLSLAFLVKIPVHVENRDDKPKFNVRNYVNDLRGGFKAVWASALLCRLMLYMTVLNFVSSIASYGLLAPMILARSGNNEVVLAVVNSATGLGSIAGALLILIMPSRTKKRAGRASNTEDMSSKPQERLAAGSISWHLKKSRRILLYYLFSFIFGDILFALGRDVSFWAATAFMSAVFIPAITANATYFWRTIIPIALQGRAFAVRYAIQSAAIPLGVLAGGLLADFVFEPFMKQPPLLLERVFGAGSGAGMALMFFIFGLMGVVLSMVFLLTPPATALSTAPENPECPARRLPMW